MRAAAIQLNSTDDHDRNLQVAEKLVRDAAADGAELVALPEKWTFLGPPEGIAEAATRPTIPTSDRSSARLAICKRSLTKKRASRRSRWQRP